MTSSVFDGESQQRTPDPIESPDDEQRLGETERDCDEGVELGRVDLDKQMAKGRSGRLEDDFVQNDRLTWRSDGIDLGRFRVQDVGFESQALASTDKGLDRLLCPLQKQATNRRKSSRAKWALQVGHQQWVAGGYFVAIPRGSRLGLRGWKLGARRRKMALVVAISKLADRGSGSSAQVLRSQRTR